MAKKKVIKDTSEPQQTHGTASCGGRKRHNEASEESICKRLRKKMDGQTVVKTGGDPQTNGKCHGNHKKDRSTSIVHHIYKNALGQNMHCQMRQCCQEPFLRSLDSYRLYRTTSPFDRRITCLEWHPTHPSTLAVASKGGDIVLTDYETLNNTTFIQGIGAGGSITDMKFNPFNHNQLFTSSIGGATMLQDFAGKTLKVYASTEYWDFWFCSVDVSPSRQVVVTGDNVGWVKLLSIDGEAIWNHRLHKAKVTHAEFNPCCDWLLATASVDHTVKLWDLRSIKDKTSFLHEMRHEKAVNSAYFSPVDGSKLLTTDQYDEIRVYCSSDWSKPQKVISHPHRQFQHLTPIKATWHPMYDLIVAGRYPDQRVCPGESRTIDIFDGKTGALKYQLHDPNAPGIISLNKFSPMGDVLGSGMGFSILIWSREDEKIVDKEQDRLMREMGEEIGSGTSGVRPQHQTHHCPRGVRRGTTEKTKLKKKTESLLGIKTKTKTKENLKPQKDKKK
ncbi:DNA damage-binding protein 2-like isoform X2 [Conger conger]|uniref:DNA damage-binding protein 2-like isoform X2 n=1 Tax=Conger conger TaxID=82655 RepID=UPI002A59B146|nr:DNA damage-binding protein 2-like isoform X2 [Conger conger]